MLLGHAELSEAVGLLETREARLMSWGFYDLSFSAHDLEDALNERVEAGGAPWWPDICTRGGSVDDVVSELERCGLVYRQRAGDDRLRTRFGEGVRLIARLKQVFSADQWATGPRLVSDIKVQLSPRLYPLRNEDARDCWRDLAPFSSHGDLQARVFRALSVDSDGAPLKFTGFQRRAFTRILEGYGSRGLTGTVVSAGTGAGKTKAFYVPALLGLAADLARETRPFTKIIAIYPRNVLLADQLREALSEVSKMRSVMEASGARAPTIGALLGDTPEESWFTERGGTTYAEKFSGWRRGAGGWIVPYLRSPVSSGKELVWRDEDRINGRSALFRADGTVAAPDVPDGALVLTRQQLEATPPDILFLSLEMLNQNMGNPAWGSAFGLVGSVPKPRLLLLDEIHTYEGITGAQAAWVLRRWRHWGRIGDVHIVGLSATLKDAPSHLAQLTGIAVSDVQDFRPDNDELRAADIEYNLIVKGNPAAGASLLATSIQSAMLLCRLLTPANAPFVAIGRTGPAAFFGRKVFGFTDKLDVVNRWFADMQDAEGRRRLARFRVPPSMRRPPLAVPEVTIRAMESEGQIWGLPVSLGHDLSRALRVERCSSQDPGLTANADLIVATSSLEVGYDDPEVGATLHHKSPRSLASFIQRRGRAGRRPGTRPWTVVVLSDYGVDRWAFQNAERLFQPEVNPILLPVANRHVLRVQTVFALIDWIGRRVARGNPYEYLRSSRRAARPQRDEALRAVRELLEGGQAWTDFRHEIRNLFRYPRRGFAPLSDEDIDALLWEPPRSLVEHALPTLLRRLEADWRYADPQRSEQVEDADIRRPLPLYIPSATFAELDVGETRLVFSGPTGKDPEFSGHGRALLESCPGNVSKRYAVGARESGYWLSFSQRLVDAVPPTRASVAELFRDRLFLDVVDGVSVFQPVEIELSAIPAPSVRDTSRAAWVWESDIRSEGAGQSVAVFRGVPWVTVGL